MENTFSLLHDFLFVFHVLVIAPRRKCIGFLAVEPPLDSVDGDERFSLVDNPATDFTVDWSDLPLSESRNKSL